MDRIDLLDENKRDMKKAHSMQFRFLTTVVTAMIAITVFVGGISIYEVDQYIQYESQSFVKATCENEGTQINESLNDMEKSVKIMGSYVMGFFGSKAEVEDIAMQKMVTERAEEMFVDVAEHTNGAIAYYLRFNPEISDSKAGLFYSKTNGSNRYTCFEPTDIALYDKEDTGHVGWFWQPYEAGEAVWMKPYYNENNNIFMISYVVPMYYEEEFVGVVGMDFDYMVLANRVHKIKVYENGFAHLEVDGVLIHDGDVALEEKLNDKSKRFIRESKELVNGMDLIVYADYADIQQIRYEIAFKILFAGLMLSALFIVVTAIIVKKIVEPLKKLTYASEKLSNGDYNVEFAQSNTYEVRLLSAAFENMAVHLCEREKLLQHTANRDSLTGLRNTTAYKSWVDEFEKGLSYEDAEFGIAVLDVNYLKKANDEYGHEVGNKLIVSAAKIISNTFKRSPVFRIGGDEFLAVLKNMDLENCEELFLHLDNECAKTFIDGNENIPVSIARGFARFDKDKDSDFTDVFKRADKAMYENKRKSKEGKA